MMAKGEPAEPAGEKTTTIGDGAPMVERLVETAAPASATAVHSEPAPKPAPAAKVVTITGHDDFVKMPAEPPAKQAAAASVQTDAPVEAKATNPYLALSGEAYSIVVDAYAAASRRRLDYFKALYDIVSRPYGPVTLEQAAREHVDRTSEIVSLSIAEFEASGKKTAELTRTWLDHSAKMRDFGFEAARDLMKAGVSNLEAVRDTTTKHLANSKESSHNGRSGG